MAKTRSEHVVINTGASIAMSLAQQLAIFVLKAVFIRTLGDQYNSVSSLFSSILSMLSMAELGIGSAIAFSLYKPIKESDPRRIASLMGFYKTAYRLVALIVTVAGVCCVPFLPNMVQMDKAKDIKESITLIYLLFIADSAASYLLVYKSTLLTAGQKRYIISIVSIIFSLVRTVVQIAIIFLTKNYIAFLVFGIFEHLLRNYVISRLADKFYPEIKDYPDEKLSKGEIKRLLADVFALSLYKVNGVIVTHSNNIIISIMTAQGFLAVGFLSVYRTIIHAIDSFINQFFNAALPSLGNLATGATKEKQLSVFNTLLFATFWCCCFCITSLFVLTSPFVNLVFGKNYLQPNYILAALLLDNYVMCMMRPVHNFRNSNGLFVQGKWRPLATTIINVGLSIALARPLGIFGILIATTISRLLTTFWFDPYLVYSKVFETPVWGYAARYAMYGLTTLLSCAVAFYTTKFIHFEHAYVNFLFKMVTCLLVPNGLVILLFRRTSEFSQFTGYLMRLWDPVKAKLQARFRRTRAPGEPGSPKDI